MALTDRDRRLAAAIEDGLPLVERPYAEIGARAGLSEDEVIAGLARLRDLGVIKRFGVVVRHHELGYRANAMVVWDVPDDRVADLGNCFGKFDFVTLCYRRPRRLPDWPYNLFCMVHGRARETVLEQVEFLARSCGVTDLRHEVLFSGTRFKQRGARYRRGEARKEAAE
ncbi:MAG: Lrp/AsnC family transcriptional regulator [Hyphomicrobiales bacterium]|nr:Lrp/AsnC family transcriptional regulator [Hyphomicrobiales bacterium]MCP5373782.1 Lrp/AsnC family transcriptional regulator [Hyphomicrobiales bacterium]